MNALYATNDASQSPVSDGDSLTFATTDLTEGTAISHTGGSGDFTLNDAGTYLISYSTVGTNTSSTGTASVQLKENGAAIPGSTSSGTISAASNTTNLAATVMIDATAATTITLTMVGTGTSFTNSSMLIRKED